MENNIRNKVHWSENVIIADADHIDNVAFDLIVNFERMIGRRIPPADMAKWVDCVAIDGGIREGDNEVLVILIHERLKKAMDNFVPANFQKDLDGMAFKDHLGEFSFSSYPVEEMVESSDFFIDILNTICAQKEVKRVMVIPNAERDYDHVRHALEKVDDDKRLTVFSMQPMQGGNFRQEILGYSLMSALGIKANEIK